MSKFCSKGCKDIGEICDFCRLYNFNSDINGVYIGKGYCTYWEHPREPEDGCKEFICRSYKTIKSAIDREKKITNAYSKSLKKKKA